MNSTTPFGPKCSGSTMNHKKHDKDSVKQLYKDFR